MAQQSEQCDHIGTERAERVAHGMLGDAPNGTRELLCTGCGMVLDSMEPGASGAFSLDGPDAEPAFRPGEEVVRSSGAWAGAWRGATSGVVLATSSERTALVAFHLTGSHHIVRELHVEALRKAVAS